MKIISVDKKECIAKVQIELDAEEINALWQAVRDNDLYQGWWNTSIQSHLFVAFIDAIIYMQTVPQGFESKVIDETMCVMVSEKDLGLAKPVEKLDDVLGNESQQDIEQAKVDEDVRQQVAREHSLSETLEHYRQ